MKIVCDRCGNIYFEVHDSTFGTGNNRNPMNKRKKEYHLCPSCARIIEDCIKENIPLKHKGSLQTEFEEEMKIQNDYYDSLGENDIP